MPLFYDTSIEQLDECYSNDYPHLQVKDLKRDLYPLYKDFASLSDNISQNGITAPLRVVGNKLVDGHHRAIIIKELGIKTVPIEYSGVLSKAP